MTDVIRVTGSRGQPCVFALNTWLAFPHGTGCFTGHGRFEQADSLTRSMHSVSARRPTSLLPEAPQNRDGEGGQGYLPCLGVFWLQLLVELAEVINPRGTHQQPEPGCLSERNSLTLCERNFSLGSI